MSSENRWISRKTFDREVPPLKHIWGTPWRQKKVAQCPTDPEIFFNGRIGGIAAVGGLFEVGSALIRRTPSAAAKQRFRTNLRRDLVGT